LDWSPLKGRGQLTAKIYAVRQLVHLGALPMMKYLLFVFALTVLTGCSQVFSTMDEVPKSQSETDYRKLIAKTFVTAFRDYASYNTVEISAPRLVDSMFGHTSMTCVRFEAKGRRRVYVFFIRNDAVVDARYDVQTDQCGAQSYQPFDPASGSERPVIAAPQNPLY
jgi:hypothetical protein